MVLGAVQSRAPCAQKALAELGGLYLRPLYALRRRGHSPEDAQDLVTGFFEHLIGSRGLATVERSKGVFRLLLASFQNFITAENRGARAEKHGGRAEVKGCGNARRLQTRRPAYAGDVLRRAMGTAAFRRATERLEQEHAVAGKAKTFRTLKGFLGREVDRHAPVTRRASRGRPRRQRARNVTSLIHRPRQRHTAALSTIRTALVRSFRFSETHQSASAICRISETIWVAGTSST